MKINNKISIGIPVYNGEPYIKKAIKSILDQSYSNIELIISDDASTDTTLSICKDLAKLDDRIKIFTQPYNIGSLRNFQFVLDAANGEFFMWASQDDFYEKNWIQELLHISGLNNASFGTVQFVDQRGKSICTTANDIKFKYVGNNIFRKMKYIFTPHISGKMILLYCLYPTEILKYKWNVYLSKRIDTSEYDADDFFFIIEILDKLNIKSTNTTKFYKRIHTQSHSFKLLKNNTLNKLVYKLKILITPSYKLPIIYNKLNNLEKFVFVIIYPIGTLYYFFGSIKIFYNYRISKLIKKSNQ